MRVTIGPLPLGVKKRLGRVKWNNEQNFMSPGFFSREMREIVSLVVERRCSRGFVCFESKRANGVDVGVTLNLHEAAERAG